MRSSDCRPDIYLFTFAMLVFRPRTSIEQRRLEGKPTRLVRHASSVKVVSLTFVLAGSSI